MTNTLALLEEMSPYFQDFFREYDFQIVIHDPLAKPSQRMVRATGLNCNKTYPDHDGDVWIETITYKQDRRCGTFFFTDGIGSQRVMRLYEPSPGLHKDDSWVKLDRIHYASKKNPHIVWLEAKTEKITCFVSLKTGLIHFDEPPSGASVVLYFRSFGLAEF